MAASSIEFTFNLWEISFFRVSDRTPVFGNFILFCFVWRVSFSRTCASCNRYCFPLQAFNVRRRQFPTEITIFQYICAHPFDISFFVRAPRKFEISGSRILLDKKKWICCDDLQLIKNNMFNIHSIKCVIGYIILFCLIVSICRNLRLVIYPLYYAEN